jgi:4-diphosphocytidyl-2-C-methyl-D-erythritol kinase
VSDRAEITVQAPAKVNLELRVGGLRPDGYHELATVFQAVSLYDDVTVAEDDEFSITVEGPGADRVPTDETNLAVAAARLLAERTGAAGGARMHLRKAIPVAGGMAGGSADAAAALIACDALWNTGLRREELVDLAAVLGSDVAFALHGGTAMGTGRGERLTPALARGGYEWVLALSTGGLSTPAVYAELDRLRADRVLIEPRVSEALMQVLRRGDPRAVAPLLHNDMEPAACSLAPGLAGLLAAGRSAGALTGMVSGSGPTLAFLAAGPGQALDLANVLAALPGVREVKRVRGPVPGARIVEPVRA